MTVRRVLLVLWLAGVWELLWGGTWLPNALGGVLVGIVLVAVLTPAGRAFRSTHRVGVRPLAAVRFAVVFLFEVARANVIVAWQVATWRSQRFREAVLAVPTQLRSPGLVTLLADCVSLTPGTLTLDTDPDRHVLYIHALHIDDDGTSVRNAVARFERMIAAAFPERPADGLAGGTTDPAEEDGR